MPGPIISSLRGKPHVHLITSMHHNLGPHIAFACEIVVKSLEVVYSSLKCDSAAVVRVCLLIVTCSRPKYADSNSIGGSVIVSLFSAVIQV